MLALTKTRVERHIRAIAKINFGLVMNMLLVPCFFYGFLVALCLKFDGRIGTSIFVLLIPVWTVLLPLMIYLVLNGVATKNSRASKLEKVCLSFMVPCKL